MGVAKVSAKEILDSIPANDLMGLAVMKLIREGMARGEISRLADEFSWSIENAIKRGDL